MVTADNADNLALRHRSRKNDGRAVVPVIHWANYVIIPELSPTRALVSWYSSHETDADGKTITAIYLADLKITD